MQLACYIRRRHYDYVGLLTLYDFGIEITIGLPVLIDALFNIGSVVCAGHLGGSHSLNNSP